MADAVAIFSPGQRLVDASGTPYAGATITFYNAGSTDPKEVYSDSDLQNSLGSVVYTDSAGYPVTAEGGTTKTQVFTGTSPYKLVIFDSATAETTTHDNCVGAVVSSATEEAVGITQDQADLRYIRNANALSSITSLADSDIFPVWQISGSGNRGITFAYLKTELTTDFQADGRMFPTGTRLVFQMTTPPTGWTKETGSAYDDAALRFETGTVGTGGSASFNTTFASRTFTGSVGNDTPSVSKTAAHQHDLNIPTFAGEDLTGGIAGAGSGTSSTGTIAVSNGAASTGSGTAHNHSLTMNAADFAVKYVEACVAQKA